MTDPGQHGRGVTTRWRMLAERRLNYLVELQETGRWTLYYSEPDFLKVIDEARAAVKTWEQLAPLDIGSANGVEAEDNLRKT